MRFVAYCRPAKQKKQWITCAIIHAGGYWENMCLTPLKLIPRAIKGIYLPRADFTAEYSPRAYLVCDQPALTASIVRHGCQMAGMKWLLIISIHSVTCSTLKYR